jgi:tetratricopeptide (TPR) repeat protein
MTHGFNRFALLLVLPLVALSATAMDRKAVDDLYDRAILEDGNLDGTLAALTATAADRSKPAAARADAHLIRSDLLWRIGQRQPALEAVDQALAIRASFDALVQKARLLDASGEMAQARTWYEKSLPRSPDAARADQVRLRLALMSCSSGDPGALVELSRTHDQAFRNRAAVALAILGHQKEALDLFKVISPPGPARFHEQLRLTEWAIRAGDARRAQAQAWEAANSTRIVADQRYALSLLVEAHRLDDTLGELSDRFAHEKNLLPEARQVWIDLLREANRYDEAIALVKGGDERRLTVQERHQLLRLYREAGRDAAMVLEYRKLIAAEPARLDWPRGLAEYYAGAGDSRAAEAVWRDFLKANDSDAGLVQAGAAAAAQMGFDALAVETLEALISRGEHTAAPARRVSK